MSLNRPRRKRFKNEGVDHYGRYSSAARDSLTRTSSIPDLYEYNEFASFLQDSVPPIDFGYPVADTLNEYWEKSDKTFVPRRKGKHKPSLYCIVTSKAKARNETYTLAYPSPMHATSECWLDSANGIRFVFGSPVARFRFGYVIQCLILNSDCIDLSYSKASRVLMDKIDRDPFWALGVNGSDKLVTPSYDRLVYAYYLNRQHRRALGRNWRGRFYSKIEAQVEKIREDIPAFVENGCYSAALASLGSNMNYWQTDSATMAAFLNWSPLAVSGYYENLDLPGENWKEAVEVLGRYRDIMFSMVFRCRENFMEYDLKRTRSLLNQPILSKVFATDGVHTGTMEEHFLY